MVNDRDFLLYYIINTEYGHVGHELGQVDSWSLDKSSSIAVNYDSDIVVNFINIVWSGYSIVNMDGVIVYVPDVNTLTISVLDLHLLSYYRDYRLGCLLGNNMEVIVYG